MAFAIQHSAQTEVIAYEDPTLPIKFVYDTLTPRAHFISIQKQAKLDVTTNELEALFQLIGRFLSKHSELNTEAIFSFHRGAWTQQNTKGWHAHLCVEKQAYLRLAKVAIKVDDYRSFSKKNNSHDVAREHSNKCSMDKWCEGY